MNLLVLTTRNIYENTGEKTLMLSKDKALRRESINLFYYSFRRKFLQNNENIFNIVKQDSMFNLIFKKNHVKTTLKKIIEECKIDVIIISGNWILFLHKELEILKKIYNIKISYDYQGAIEEVKEYKLFKNNQFLSNILFLILKRYEKLILEISDGVEAVSENALVHIKNSYKINNKYNSIIVHCGIETPIEYNKWIRYRKEWRDKYNISDNDIACVYAGGIAKWQNIKEIINKAIENKNMKLYIYTSPRNQEIIQNIYSLSSNIYFDFLSHDELQKALCSFDYGFLLRNKDVTNFVAFPNKYSDYINARLRVIVKNNYIGCFPKEEDKRQIIHYIDHKIDKKRTVEQKIFDEYINELSYDNMIYKLSWYYKEL